MRLFSKVGWWVFDNIPLGNLAPYWFGMLIGRWPHRVKDK